MAQAPSQTYHAINLDRDRIALKLYDRYGKKYPDIYRDYSAAQKAQMIEDFRNHVSYLQESLAISDPAIFIDYAGWAQVRLSSLSFHKNQLSSSLEVLQEVLREELPPDDAKKSDEYLAKSIAFLSTAPAEVSSFLRDTNPLDAVAHRYLDALLGADRNLAMTIITTQVKNGVPAREIYHKVLEPVLHETGRLWQMQKISIAEEHFVTSATQLILAQLYLPSMTDLPGRTVGERRLLRPVYQMNSMIWGSGWWPIFSI
jgi:MerR family transcriptional regulator, light-induced transcriptional regulator